MTVIKKGIILLISLFILIGILVINERYGTEKNGANTILDNNVLEKSNTENLQLSNLSSAVFQENPQPESIKSNFSGEILTCTNKSDIERVIDVRLSNFISDNESITIYPLNFTINLLPKQIKRIDLHIPYGISTFKLVSGNGGELEIQSPPCVNGYEGSGSNTGFNTQTTTKKVDEIPEFPSIMLPVIAIMALLFIMKKRK
ncbi:MAG: PEF-CTERM sorting domain-containing protein [Candidatus Methanoperedens sp.]|nr:PEF-CTERM sorting domain-containing protein [Candidatus Methanoperedens sp.]